MGHADTLLAMGGAFLAAAFLARLGSRIGLPTIPVPLFMLAGILLGPHTPGLVLVGDAHDFSMLSALGLVLLLFYLGLEFHLDDLRRGGKQLISAGGIYLALNVGAGLGFGFALGRGTREALVLAGVLGISSCAIVTKILIELGHISRPETRLLLGVTVVAAMATGAGLDDRLTPFIAGYVLVLAVLGPVLAQQSRLLAHALRAAQARLPDCGSSRDAGPGPGAGPSSGTGLPPGLDAAPDGNPDAGPVPGREPAEAER
ncbi:cation:proton antiporter [Streptomyces sp. KMM 9044]|nr:cation:proton antiporter [Streptomyces sp. KMM 9044]WAX79249.1 cation:proton antiporter [Streptomyces sp. KMM 9044]